MLTPQSIPGEVVSPRILRHAPSCNILVTQPAPDPRTSTGIVMVGLLLRSVRVFRRFSWLEVGSVKVALSRPTHQRVTRAVRWLGSERHLNGQDCSQNAR